MPPRQPCPNAGITVMSAMSSIWVENRIGPGYGLNMGNPRAWLLFAGMMLVPMIAARLLF